LPYLIGLKAIFSKPAAVLPKGVQLPRGWNQLSWHQVETLNALRDENCDVVINTAMTGDGKSLAACLPMLFDRASILSLYPTNELAREQETQVRGYIAQFQPKGDPRVARLSSAELEIYAEQEVLSKSAALLARSGQSEVLLANPDIFHYLHRGAYLTKNDNPDKLWGRVDSDFNLIVFDEFHVFNEPQVSGVLNTMLLIRCIRPNKKFLFLSATPDQQLIDRLNLAGFRTRIINPLESGGYQFPETTEQFAQIQSQGWRQIVQPIDLEFISLEPSVKASEAWIEANQEQILGFFQANLGSKGAIILNSIAAVKRLLPKLRALLEPFGLIVRENTGLTGASEKLLSLEADLVLGTSTIDVGVDFKINYLIFESADAGNFVQRLGRLGRHSGYERNGQQVAFENFKAVALVPNFLVERLFLSEVPPLVNHAVYDRPFFHEQIRQEYRKINDFSGYYSRWGTVQSFQILNQLRSPTIKSSYAGSSDAFEQASELVFGAGIKKQYKRIKDWKEDWQALSGNKPGNPIFEDAVFFRGRSELQCGLYDLTEANPADRFKTYALPSILGNLEVETWTEAAFLRTLEEVSARTGQPIAKGRFRYCLAFMKLRSYREERLNWRFYYNGDLSKRTVQNQVQVLTGIEVYQPDNAEISHINRKLKQQALVSLVIMRPLSEVRSRLRLPMHFQIYGISDQRSFLDPSPPYSIAFSQSALLLETLAWRVKEEGGEGWIV
jgi:CRISPR-associated endonuclease/helicase Cas3